ncbi:uncharacterized protein F13E9.13, mitochondrial-like [Convolutriloba macropyga]|uniref:uncharacterized protein F13E9.13, mitochondrial-like n=1 Tax=Convolutriloba macropyga TaxID=536237 RepID=UPI003F5273A5
MSSLSPFQFTRTRSTFHFVRKQSRITQRQFQSTSRDPLCAKWNPALYGMIHILPTAATPLWKRGQTVTQTIERALEEAELFKKYNFSGVIIENMFDVPYLKSSLIQPHTVTTMTAVAIEVRKILTRDQGFSIGIQILSGANMEALAVALAADCDFIRAEGFVFGQIGDEGYTESCAGQLLRYRKSISAEHIKVFCDIQKKHSSHAITGDLTIDEHAKAAEFFEANGLVITGKHTGQTADRKQLLHAKNAAPKLPVLVGSGVTPENISQYQIADGLIIGSSLKFDGKWHNKLEEMRICKLIEKQKQIFTFPITA